MNPVKTLSEHREYLYEIVKLKLFFAYHWLKAHPEETFSDVLRKRIDIIRKTDINEEGLNPVNSYFDTPAWLELEADAEKQYHHYSDDPEAFEAAAFEVFRPSIDARCERDFLDRSAFKGYQCGFLRHNLEVSKDYPNMLIFHIANAKAPDSFFDFPDYMRDCFKQLLDIAENEFKVSEIATGTWLNSVPKWLALFPEEWQANLQPPKTDVQWHYGFWGQFITARGTFNYKYGSILRKTGKLPFYPRFSHCSIQAMRMKIAEPDFGCQKAK
ncbi:MAG: hypothetical protein GX927_10540 [Lentisphaerae bacterium]|jgi:hypothetical protein|nr:hypothetical protein [Lentisphaerota bacterium]